MTQPRPVRFYSYKNTRRRSPSSWAFFAGELFMLAALALFGPLIGAAYLHARHPVWAAALALAWAAGLTLVLLKVSPLKRP